MISVRHYWLCDCPTKIIHTHIKSTTAIIVCVTRHFWPCGIYSLLRTITNGTSTFTCCPYQPKTGNFLLTSSIALSISLYILFVSPQSSLLWNIVHRYGKQRLHLWISSILIRDDQFDSYINLLFTKKCQSQHRGVWL